MARQLSVHAAPARRTKKKRRNNNHLLVFAMALFVGICSFKIVGTQIKISEKEYQLRQLEQSIEEQQQKNQELEDQLEKRKANQGEAVEKAAFEQYGYGYSDEHIYIDSQAS